MTDQAAPIWETPHFSVSRVLEDSFETVFRIFPQLLAITTIIAVPLLVWIVLGGAPIIARFASTVRLDGAAPAFDPVLIVLVVFIGLIGLAINAAVSDAAFRHLLDQEGDILNNLSRAALSAPSVIVAGLFVSILLGISFAVLGLAFGLLSAIHWTLGAVVGIGGLVGLLGIMVRWSVIVPAIVIEQSGPVDCFRRSGWLTDGNRAKVFALLLIVYAPQGLIKVLLMAATPLAGAVFVGILNIAISGVFITFNAVATVTIYAHLRAIKEGSGTTELAEVFD
jgi:hypothetical protein